jgi:carbamoyl-phosphate synthase large subunit
VRSLNVLVTAASRRVPLIRAFQRALAGSGAHGRVIVADVNPLSPGVHAADDWYDVPMADDPAYIDSILTICDHESIGLVVPTIDDELVMFGEARRSFDDRGIRVAVSPAETSRICNDKYLTAQYLREWEIPAAETWLPSQIAAVPRLPLFIKPRFGRGSVGAFPIKSSRELAFFREYVSTPVIQEYLHGPEFTIDLCCDFQGRLLSVVPRERVVIRSGVTDRGRTVKDPKLMELAETLAHLMPFVGAANIQCRVVDGRPVIFEINPRFSGGIPLTIAAGADFPRMLVEVSLGRRVQPAIGQFRHNLWMTNYESSVFVEGERVSAGIRSHKLPLGYVA